MYDIFKNRKLLRIILVIFVLLLASTCLFVYLFIYSNQIDEGSRVVTKNTFFCPLGNELEDSIDINFENAIEVYYLEYGLNSLFSSIDKPEIKLFIEMIDILNNNQRQGEVSDLKCVTVPEHASYILSPKINQQYLNSLVIDTDLKDFLSCNEIQIYAWNTEYNHISGNKHRIREFIMILNEIKVYGKIDISGDTKMQMSIVLSY